MSIVGRGFLTTLFHEDPLILPTPPCYFLLNDIMVLHMSNLVTLVPRGPNSVFYATRDHFTEV